MPTCEPEHHPQSDEQEVDQPTRRRCRHIFAAGRRCGSPCLRKEHFCYYHHTTRRPVSSPRQRRSRTDVLDLPNPEDRDSARAAVTQIMHAIALNNIDIKRAGMLLYSLQISLATLPPQPRPAPLKTSNSIPLKDLAEDLVYQEPHGYIAPEDDYEEPEELKPRRSFARQLLDDVEEYEAEQAAKAAEKEARRLQEVAEAQHATEAGAPRLDSETWDSATEALASPLASAPSAPPRRPAAIDLTAAAEPHSRCTKKCRPERSGSQFNRDPRSRRTCGSHASPPTARTPSDKDSRFASLKGTASAVPLPRLRTTASAAEVRFLSPRRLFQQPLTSRIHSASTLPNERRRELTTARSRSSAGG